MKSLFQYAIIFMILMIMGCTKESQLVERTPAETPSFYQGSDKIICEDKPDQNSKEEVLAKIMEFVQLNGFQLNWLKYDYTNCGTTILAVIPFTEINFEQDRTGDGMTLAVAYLSAPGKIKSGIYLIQASDQAFWIVAQDGSDDRVDLDPQISISDDGHKILSCGTGTSCEITPLPGGPTIEKTCCVAIACTNGFLWTGCWTSYD